MIRDRGRDSSEESCVLIENGRFYGMGWLDKDLTDPGSGNPERTTYGLSGK